MRANTISIKVVLYRGCSVVRRHFVEQFFNRTKKGGAGMDVHHVISWTPYDQNGEYIRWTQGPLLRDCKSAIDYQINR
jgi:hypothetical protein